MYILTAKGTPILANSETSEITEILDEDFEETTTRINTNHDDKPGTQGTEPRPDEQKQPAGKGTTPPQTTEPEPEPSPKPTTSGPRCENNRNNTPKETNTGNNLPDTQLETPDRHPGTRTHQKQNTDQSPHP
ncbi:mucin-2-like [Ceratina calcarata]|uniref:Mucin-2-like n=1 Tax=Ceratina calcarata TaxID=156304 RepID=A0AAJ7JB67_9HYME|nr:mucin-2-like [Ceratina calcarata]